MQCEICGQEIHGRPQKINLEGTSLEVCQKCAPHGKPINVWTPSAQKIAPTGQKIASAGHKAYTRRPRRDIFDSLKEELLPDYEIVLKKARESAGLTLEELAAKISEKASLIRKIERGEIHPEDSVRKKLEHTLNIKLTEQTSSEDYKLTSGNKGTTLGDIAIIRRK